eukprot:GILK01001438.1.p2 GENE.GILK01001438.1~~GILK01001438.1.p2  ORF type:complete len:270 (+),score=45.02 GILK01001438.1:108-812(+)
MSKGKKIIAVGKNYRDHVKEMGGSSDPKAPVLFLKPTSSFIREPKPIEIPDGELVHHEVELAVVIGKEGRDIPLSQAMKHVAGYTVALDLTARDLQAEAKKAGLPWSVSKGFDTFTPISQYIDASRVSDPHNLTLWCKVNGELKQRGNTSGMIFSVPHVIAYISSIMTLEEGDTILTGTPSGVGPIRAGDTISAGIEGLVEMSFPVVDRVRSYRFGSSRENVDPVELGHPMSKL